MRLEFPNIILQVQRFWPSSNRSKCPHVVSYMEIQILFAIWIARFLHDNELYRVHCRTSGADVLSPIDNWSNRKVLLDRTICAAKPGTTSEKGFFCIAPDKF